MDRNRLETGKDRAEMAGNIQKISKKWIGTRQEIDNNRRKQELTNSKEGVDNACHTLQWNNFPLLSCHRFTQRTPNKKRKRGTKKQEKEEGREEDRRPTNGARRWHHASTRTRPPVLRRGWNYHTDIASVLSEGPVNRRNQPLPGAPCRYQGRTRSWYQASRAFWAKGGNSWDQNQFCFVNGRKACDTRDEGERQISRWNARFKARTCEANGSSWRVSESTNQTL